MARRNGALGVTMVVMMMMMIAGGAAQAPAPPPAVDCEAEVLTLTDCLGYVMGTDKTPPAACCTELSKVINSNPQCLCVLFNTTFTEPLGVNVTLAQQLPPACKLQTPPTSLCSQFGFPVPGPVGAVAPSPANSSTTAPATSPMAPSPMAPSPISPTPISPTPTTSPVIAPAGSTPASEPAPMSTAPTGSTTPAGTPNSNATTTPSPNSALSSTSLNAAVAASLLFLASIFLS